ncbi:hypothetical protein KAH55_02010, partial [bacterium]|nr:hypothetical protein [bacterium]
MKRAYYFLVVIALFVIQFTTQAFCFDHQDEVILSGFLKLQQQDQVTERRVTEILTNLGCPCYSPSDVSELVNGLRDGIQEDQLKTILLRLYEQNRHYRDDEDDDRPGLFRKTSFGKQFAHPPVFQQEAAMTGILEDFQVNENVGRNIKEYPAMDMNANGNFVIAWLEWGQNSPRSIYCQLFNSNGTPLGNKIKANNLGRYSCLSPDVAMDNNGNFVVVWCDHNPNSNNPDIIFQRFNSNGAPLGNNVKVNTDGVVCYHHHPAIEMDDSGNFVIVWYDDHRLGDWKYDIFGQRYNSAGTALGANFMINDSQNEQSLRAPAIAMDGSGNFIVAWHEDRLSVRHIFCRRYNSSGTPLEDNFQVSNTAGATYPDIGIDDSGNFVIIWTRSSNPYSRCYNSNGVALGDEFKVSDGNVNFYHTSVSVHVDGSFVVSWVERLPDPDPNDFYSPLDIYF